MIYLVISMETDNTVCRELNNNYLYIKVMINNFLPLEASVVIQKKKQANQIASWIPAFVPTSGRL